MRISDWSSDVCSSDLFIQVNGSISQQTVNQAIAWLDLQPNERVLELSCGLGNFSLPLARRGAQVLAVEGEKGLVQRPRENAELNGLEIRFEKADLFTATGEENWLRSEEHTSEPQSLIRNSYAV